MNFKDEKAVYENICEIIIKSGATLYNIIKYTYAAAENDFYNINVKDIFKIGLSNLSKSDNLSLLGIKLSSETCSAMNSQQFERLLPLIVYSIAIRLPLLKRVKEITFTDSQIKEIYKSILKKGAENIDNLVEETFDDYRKYIKHNNESPAYNSDFFKAFIYKNVPQVAEINNKNLYIFGVSDVLFPLFWYSFEEEIVKSLKDYII